MRLKLISRGLLGAAIAAALALTGCASTGPDGTGNSASPGGGSTASAEPLIMTIFGGDTDLKVYRERAELVKEKLGIEVDVQLVVDDYERKLQTMIAGGQAPDIMHISETIHAFSSRGVLAPLDDFIAASSLDLDARFGPIGQRYVREGQVWGLPDRGGSMALYYNKDIFDQAGLAYPTNDWTWDDVLSTAQQLTIRDGDDFTQFGYVAGDWWPWWSSFMYQNGGGFLDGRTPVLDSPENREALQFYLDLSLKHRVAPTPLDYANLGLGNSSTDALFVQSKVGFFTSGYWFMKSARETEGLRWGAAQVYHGKQAAIPGFGNGFAIPSDSKRQEDAFKVIDFLTTVEGQMPIATNGQDVPTNLELAGSPVFLEPDWNSGPDPIDLSAVTPDPALIYTAPLEPEWQALEAAFKEGMATVYTGDKSLDDALPEIQAEWDRIMGVS